jgi:TRAP-type C4-dicarboxylate transport system permease small subunit
VTVLIVVSSIGRYLLAWPVPDVFDLSRLLLGIAIIWGLTGIAFSGAHIKVDVVTMMLRTRQRRLVNSFAWTMLALFTALLVWKMFGRVVNAYYGGDATMDLRLPHWPFLAAIWLGLVAALIATLWRLWLVVMRRQELAEFEDIEELVKTEPDSGSADPGDRPQ